MHQEAAPQAPKTCIKEAHDPDEQARNLTHWQQRYDQISAGAFYGRITEAPLQGTQVFKELTSQALRQQCRVRPGALWLGIPDPRQAQRSPVRINGLAARRGELLCRPGDQDFELVTPAGLEIYGIVIDHELLAQAARHQQIALPEFLAREPRLSLSPRQLSRLCGLVDCLLQADDQPLGRRVPLHLKSDRLVDTLLEGIEHIHPIPEAPPGYRRRKQVVDRVKEYVSQRQGVPITITELCRIAHVSRRTLQYSFESIVGISPLQYLRLSRLNQVRRELYGADGDTTVGEVAARWGFWHAGQFARDYRRLFGEPPSATLQRARALRRGD